MKTKTEYVIDQTCKALDLIDLNQTGETLTSFSKGFSLIDQILMQYTPLFEPDNGFLSAIIFSAEHCNLVTSTNTYATQLYNLFFLFSTQADALTK